MLCSSSKLTKLNEKLGFQEFQKFVLVNFDELYGTVCVLAQRPPMREARVGRSQGVGASFSARAHVLGSLESIRNRFDDLYFSTKIMIFRKFSKILENL